MADSIDAADEARERAELFERIARSFAQVPRPEPPVTEDAGPLNREVESALAGKAAEEITPDDARDARFGLWLLSPEAFHYYHPALLRYVLPVDAPYVDGLGEAVFEVLVPRENEELQRVFEQRMALLDEAQRDALADYVAWHLANESVVPLRADAEAYWLRGSSRDRG